MTVLDRRELQESPLADLHLIADQMGLEGFRRLRKEELIEAILADRDEETDTGGSKASSTGRARSRRTRAGRASRPREASAEHTAQTEDELEQAPGGSSRASSTRAGRERPGTAEEMAEGVVEILGNGSAFLRLNGHEPSDDDVYISAAQIRRCELVSGDRVSGPVRSPRRSERYPSLIRVEAINGEPADSVSQGTRYEDLPSAWPSERVELGGQDPTLAAIDLLAPFGRGSRVVISGAARSGKTELLRRILVALTGREDLELMLVLAGVRPEEIGDWEGSVAPLAALSFAASPDAQGQAVEGVVENAKRIAARGGNVMVLIDNLDGLHPHMARRALAAARNLLDRGSLTVMATATKSFGGETTVIALDVAHANADRLPALDVPASGTLKPELLVGEDGARTIAQARATAAEQT